LSRAGGALPLALATLAAGADTFFGPLYVAFGAADGGHQALYLSMGRSFGGPGLFGASGR